MNFAMLRANSKKRVVQCIHNSLATAQEWRRKGVTQMWKNQVDAASMPREFDSKQMSESPSKMEGEGIYLDNLSEQVGPQRVFCRSPTIDASKHGGIHGSRNRVYPERHRFH